MCNYKRIAIIVPCSLARKSIGLISFFDKLSNKDCYEYVTQEMVFMDITR